jgi:23S rRNA (pseudouridine1915-N3)-methyltransferase
MKIKLLALGKFKSPAFAELAEEYARRIKKYHRFEVLEIPDEPVRPKADIEGILKKEAERIQKKLASNSYLIVLDERGEQWSSVDLAWELGQLFQNSSLEEIVFLIGGAYGVAPSLKSRAKVVLSLSKLTLPHQLARVLALEQIYRALTILKNVPYHHE